MDFAWGDIDSIERALDEQRRDTWRRLADAEFRTLGLPSFRAAWLLQIPTELASCKRVTYVVLALDHEFPWSQPALFAPELNGEISWPHVEPSGRCCLAESDFDEDAGRRVLRHLAWLWDVLTYTPDQVREAFAEEFYSYWSQRLSKGRNPLFVSLFAPDGQTCEILFFYDRDARRYIFARSAETLTSWLTNAQRPFNQKSFGQTWMLDLKDSATPSEFPVFGRDVLNGVPQGWRERIIRIGSPLPILLSCRRAFGGVLVPPLSRDAVSRGFRRRKVQFARIEQAFEVARVSRVPAIRADGAWIHGRDNDSSFAALSQASVAVVGCGALGSMLALTLAQAGIGNLVLVDDDTLSAGNISRHLLGYPYVEQSKTAALSGTLKRSLPHIRSITPIPKRFEHLNESDLQLLSACNVVVTAGVDVTTDARISTWRLPLPSPPVLVSTWVEEFALVGHAVAIFGPDRLLNGFDAKGVARFRLTRWPDEVATQTREPGCGNFFQPHGAVDLLPTIALAGDLVIEILLHDVAASQRRVWMGCREDVATKGGEPLSAFDASDQKRVFSWEF